MRKPKYTLEDHLKSKAFHSLYDLNYTLQRTQINALIKCPEKIDNREGKDFFSIQDDIESLSNKLNKLFKKLYNK